MRRSVTHENTNDVARRIRSSVLFGNFMSYDHSDFAAMMGFCECDSCSGDAPTKMKIDRIEDWHLWTIRGREAGATKEHRIDMKEMGFTVGPIEISDGTMGIPMGWFMFDARIPKAALDKETFERLCAWDRRNAELPNAELSDGAGEKR